MSNFFKRFETKIYWIIGVTLVGSTVAFPLVTSFMDTDTPTIWGKFFAWLLGLEDFVREITALFLLVVVMEKKKKSDEDARIERSLINFVKKEIFFFDLIPIKHSLNNDTYIIRLSSEVKSRIEEAKKEITEYLLSAKASHDLNEEIKVEKREFLFYNLGSLCNQISDLRQRAELAGLTSNTTEQISETYKVIRGLEYFNDRYGYQAIINFQNPEKVVNYFNQIIRLLSALVEDVCKTKGTGSLEISDPQGDLKTQLIKYLIETPQVDVAKDNVVNIASSDRRRAPRRRRAS